MLNSNIIWDKMKTKLKKLIAAIKQVSLQIL